MAETRASDMQIILAFNMWTDMRKASLQMVRQSRSLKKSTGGGLVGLVRTVEDENSISYSGFRLNFSLNADSGKTKDAMTFLVH